MYVNIFNHPIQNPLLFVTEPRTRDNILIIHFSVRVYLWALGESLYMQRLFPYITSIHSSFNGGTVIFLWGRNLNFNLFRWTSTLKSLNYFPFLRSVGILTLWRSERIFFGLAVHLSTWCWYRVRACLKIIFCFNRLQEHKERAWHLPDQII
jgi:hypothetical protein